jgi:hypothetical protein
MGMLIAKILLMIYDVIDMIMYVGMAKLAMFAL